MKKKDTSVDLGPTPLATPVEPPKKNNFDRFHPEMPQIPGVPATKTSTGASTTQQSEAVSKQPGPVSKQRLIQIGAILGVVAVVAIAISLWVNRASRKLAEVPSSEPAAIDPSALPGLSATPSAATAGDGPTVAATIEELAKPWSSKRFTYVKPLTAEQVEAMVIRLPGGGLWAFALKEPYGKCNLEFVTNLGVLGSRYGYQASHPMVVDSCSSTVYDPLKVGPLGGNTWARGEIVQGGGLRPPLSIDVQVRGHSIIADRME